MRQYSSWVLAGICAMLVISSISCKRDEGSIVFESSSKRTDLWRKFTDIPSGADPSIPDTLGGNGFEKIAESLGFVTYTPKQEELKYFGDPHAVTGGEFTIISNQFPATFRPEGQNSNSVYTSEVKQLVYESLLGTHPVTRDYVPSLASHWKISDDKMTFTFRIDPNARFSDGMPVTANDIVATYKLLMDETLLEPSNILVYSKFNEPVAISKYIVQVTCKSLNFRNLLYFSSTLIQPAHIISKMTGDEYLDAFNFNMPPGSGEYILLEKDIKLGKKYVLTRRDDYWSKDAPMSRGVGNFDRIVYSVVQDNPTLEYEKFKKGQADVYRFLQATTLKWVKDTTYESIAKGYVKRMRAYSDGPMGTGGFIFNMRSAPFDDIRVRKAFRMLLPREQIITKVLYNEYEPYSSSYPNTPYENPNLGKSIFDPDAANKLLDEAGWSQRNADGLRTKNGQPFTFDMPISPPAAKFVTPFQQELKKAGIDMKIKFEDWNSTVKNVAARNFKIYYGGYGGLLTPNPETSLNSKLADKNDNNNISGVKNARIDELCQMYDIEFDVQKQIEIIQEIDKITNDIAYYSYTWNPKGIRIAYWDRFGIPEYAIPRYSQLSTIFLSIATSWWYSPEKEKALRSAMRKGEAIDGPKNIQVVKFWKDYADKNEQPVTTSLPGKNQAKPEVNSSTKPVAVATASSQRKK